MIEFSFSDNIYALIAQVAILAQASIVCLLVLVELPGHTFTSIMGKCSIIIMWGIIVVNVVVDYPDNLDTWLNGLAIFLIATHIIKCLALHKTIQRYSTHRIKSYLMTLIFGVLHNEHWQTKQH